MNVPVWDGWERGVMLQKADAGELDLAYLTSAHIDHRPFFPRVITLASNAISGGDVRWEMWIGFVAVVAGAIGLLFVLRKTLPGGGWFWGAAFVLNLIVFSPLQYQNFLWAVQLAFLLPLGCLGLLLAVMRTTWGLRIKFSAAVVLALFASFSFGHGLILWPVAICLVLMDGGIAPLRSRLIMSGAILAVATAVLIGYFNWNYINTSQPVHAYGAEVNEPPPAVSRVDNLKKDPDRVWRYFWSSLGNPAARLMHSDPAEVSVNAGRALLILFTIALLWMFLHCRGEDHWRALLPWAACGMFAVTAAAMMASGRAADLPFMRSLLSRYLSLTMYLPIGLIGMAAYILHHYRTRDPKGGRWAGTVAVGLVGLLLGLQSQTYVYGAHKMEAWKTARLNERFQLLYLKLKPPRFPSSIDGAMSNAPEGEQPFAIKQAYFLNDKGLLKPQLFDDMGFGSFTRVRARALSKSADLTFAHLRTDGQLQLSGFATLPDGRIADGMIVAWRIAGAEVPVIEKNRSKERTHAKRIATANWRVADIIGIQAAPSMRASSEDGQFGANRMNTSKRENYARFDDPIDISTLPVGEEVELCLWVADCDRMEVAPLKRMVRVRKGVTALGEVLYRAD